MENKMRIGITHGDINGVGYEIILKTLEDSRMLDLCIPVVYGSPKVAAFYRKIVGSNLTFNLINNAKDASDKHVNMVNCCNDEIKVEISQSTAMAGEAAFSALEKAVRDLKDGHLDAIVTAPINKHNIQSVHFQFPGHTEYLEGSFGQKGDALMMLVSGNLRIAVATGHIPVAKVSENLSTESILGKLRIFNNSLQKDFGIRCPRIAVLGLNPHAGDEGLLGTEEQEVIRPALETALEEGIICNGPLPSDGFFGSDNYRKYDGILAMYHDQGLIPFKLLAMDSGVNFTAGLDIVRTSPDHGTAYDIAGQNKASENSFRQALYAAIDICRNRTGY